MNIKAKMWIAPTVLAVLGLTVYAIAQQMGQGHQMHSQCQMPEPVVTAAGSGCDHAMPSGGKSVATPDGDISGGTMLRCRMIMGMEVSSTDPVAVLALSEQLGLEDQQMQTIKDIQSKAREQTQAVLTEGQKAKLDTVADSSAGMVKVHKAVMEMMKVMHGGMLTSDAAAGRQPGEGQAGKMSCCSADHAATSQAADQAGQNAGGNVKHELHR